MPRKFFSASRSNSGDIALGSQGPLLYPGGAHGAPPKKKLNKMKSKIYIYILIFIAIFLITPIRHIRRPTDRPTDRWSFCFVGAKAPGKPCVFPSVLLAGCLVGWLVGRISLNHVYILLLVFIGFL